MTSTPQNDYIGKAVLITGGTRGIGLATGLAFGRLGARCTLTNKWGSVDDEDILEAFAAAGAPAPRIVQADAADDEDTQRVVEDILALHGKVEVLVSNVAFGQMTPKPDAYTKRGLLSAIEYSAWPLASHAEAIRKRSGAPPRYSIAISSDGPHRFMHSYDFMAAAKSVLETMVRYLAEHYHAEGGRVNAVRAGMVATESLEAVLGAERLSALKEADPRGFVTAESVAGVILALCSGSMDVVTGQILQADNGHFFSSPGPSPVQTGAQR